MSNVDSKAYFDSMNNLDVTAYFKGYKLIDRTPYYVFIDCNNALNEYLVKCTDCPEHVGELVDYNVISIQGRVCSRFLIVLGPDIKRKKQQKVYYG